MCIRDSFKPGEGDGSDDINPWHAVFPVQAGMGNGVEHANLALTSWVRHSANLLVPHDSGGGQ
eukprot:5180749-Prorocentrum_lima.AAC.1